MQLQTLLLDVGLFAAQYNCGAKCGLLYRRLLHGYECQHHIERALHPGDTTIRRLFVDTHTRGAQLDPLHLNDTLRISEYADFGVSWRTSDKVSKRLKLPISANWKSFGFPLLLPSCGNPSSFEFCKTDSTTTTFIPYEEILKAQNSTSPLWLNTLVLMMFFVVFRCLGYAVLRYVRCPKTWYSSVQWA